MTVLYTSATVLTAVCFTSGDCACPLKKHDLLFADDAVLAAHTERALQHLICCFAEASQLFWLEVSLEKTDVLHQPALLEEYRPTYITIGGIELKAVHQLIYLGCTIASDAKIDREVDNRLAKANRTFSRLYKRVWNNNLNRGHLTEVTVTMSRACLQKGRHRLPMIALCGELFTGYRNPGAPKKHFKDSLKKTLGTWRIDHHQWSTLVAHRQAWRCTVHEAVSTLRTPAEPTSGRNTTGERSRETQQPTAVAAAGIACPALAKSSISMSAVVIISLLHKCLFAKSSQEEDIYIYNQSKVFGQHQKCSFLNLKVLHQMKQV